MRRYTTVVLECLDEAKSLELRDALTGRRRITRPVELPARLSDGSEVVVVFDTAAQKARMSAPYLGDREE